MIGAGIALISLLLALPISQTIASHPRTPLFSREALFAFNPDVHDRLDLWFNSIISLSIRPETGYRNPGIFFTVFAVTLILVRAFAGKLSDKKGRKFVILPGMILIACGLLVLSTAKRSSYISCSCSSYGLGFGLVHHHLWLCLLTA